MPFEFLDFLGLAFEQEVEFVQLVRVGCKFLFHIGNVVLFLFEFSLDH